MSFVTSRLIRFHSLSAGIFIANAHTRMSRAFAEIEFNTELPALPIMWWQGIRVLPPPKGAYKFAKLTWQVTYKSDPTETDPYDSLHPILLHSSPSLLFIYESQSLRAVRRYLPSQTRGDLFRQRRRFITLTAFSFWYWDA